MNGTLSKTYNMPTRVSGQRDLRRLSANERLALLVDHGSFREIDGERVDLSRPTAVNPEKLDGVVAGMAVVNGTPVGVFSQDCSYRGGSLGVLHISKLCRTLNKAAARGSPVLGLYDSGGARIQEGMRPLAEVGGLLRTLERIRRRVPLLFAIMGPVLGGSTYSAALGHFLVIVAGQGRLFVWGPGVVQAETNREVTMEELGGADVHLRVSGLAMSRARDDGECIEMLKTILGYFPRGRPRKPKRAGWTSPVAKPPDVRGVYEARELLASVFDEGSFFELQPEFARNIVVGISSLEGRTVGVVASQPSVKKGFLDADASMKVSRLVSTCNELRVPLVTFLDSRGPSPGSEEEARGLVRETARVVEAYSARGARKVSIVVGSAFGGAFVAMASKPLGIDHVFAYPGARVGIMSPESYVQIFGKAKGLGAPAGEGEGGAEAVAAWYAGEMHPRVGVQLGYIDSILEPDETRARLVEVLDGLGRKSRPAR